MSDTQTTPSTQPDNSRSGSFLQRLLKIAPSDILRLVFLSILVGFLLAVFRVDPRRLWVDFFGTLADAWEGVVNFVMHSAADLINYFILGAVIVVPIWLILRVLRAAQRD